MVAGCKNPAMRTNTEARLSASHRSHFSVVSVEDGRVHDWAFGEEVMMFWVA
jgi:hypothetical protein